MVARENNRLREENILKTAREDGKTELIENMLDEGIDYSIISMISKKTIDEIKQIESNM